MPKVSIILTSYNHEQFLSDAIKSVLNQTMPDFQLIIWDDASTDGSWDIINNFKDERILAFRNDRNRRGAWGMNKAITEIASAEYIAIHHSDDIWRADKLKKQMAYLDTHPEVGAVFTAVENIDENGTILKLNERHQGHSTFCIDNRSRQEWLKHFFYAGNCLCHPSVMVRKKVYKAIGGYSYGFGQLSDWYAWVKICTQFEIYILEEKLTFFRWLSKGKNMSALNAKSKLRLHYELYLTLKLFQKVAASSDLYMVFPEAKKFAGSSAISNRFAFAMVMIEKNRMGLSALLGLEIIFELLQNKETAQMLSEHHDFHHTQYVELSGRYDPFNITSSEVHLANYNKLLFAFKQVAGNMKQHTTELQRLRSILAAHSIEH